MVFTTQDKLKLNREEILGIFCPGNRYRAATPGNIQL